MKKIITICLASLLVFNLISCEQDAPEINFSQQTSIVSDFSGIIDAISNVDLTLENKLDLIERAVNNGFASEAEILDLISTALETTNATLSEKLDAINGTVEAGFANNSTALDLINAALESSNTTLSDKIDAVITAVEEGSISIADAIKMLKQTVEPEEPVDERAEYEKLNHSTVDEIINNAPYKDFTTRAQWENQLQKLTRLEEKIDVFNAMLSDGIVDADDLSSIGLAIQILQSWDPAVNIYQYESYDGSLQRIHKKIMLLKILQEDDENGNTTDCIALMVTAAVDIEPQILPQIEADGFLESLGYGV